MKLLPPCCAAFVGALFVARLVMRPIRKGPWKVPDGFSIELVAEPPLVERPIVAALEMKAGCMSPSRPARTIRLKSSSKSGHTASCGSKMLTATGD